MSIGQFGCQSDRVSQTVNDVTTNYLLDLASPLTQVLSDGTNTYVYGIDSIAQVNGTVLAYFLTDGLGSVRQLVDSNGNIILAKSYQPYGTQASSAGSGSSSYGFTGEMADPTGLIYLRARYLAPNDGRFLTRDSWSGDYDRPLSLNRWNYVEGDPVNLTDPSGKYPSAYANFTSGDGSTLFEELDEVLINRVLEKIAKAYLRGYYVGASIIEGCPPTSDYNNTLTSIVSQALNPGISPVTVFYKIHG